MVDITDEPAAVEGARDPETRSEASSADATISQVGRAVHHKKLRWRKFSPPRVRSAPLWERCGGTGGGAGGGARSGGGGRRRRWEAGGARAATPSVRRSRALAPGHRRFGLAARLHCAGGPARALFRLPDARLRRTRFRTAACRRRPHRRRHGRVPAARPTLGAAGRPGAPTGRAGERRRWHRLRLLRALCRLAGGVRHPDAGLRLPGHRRVAAGEPARLRRDGRGLGPAGLHRRPGLARGPLPGGRTAGRRPQRRRLRHRPVEGRRAHRPAAAGRGPHRLLRRLRAAGATVDVRALACADAGGDPGGRLFPRAAAAPARGPAPGRRAAVGRAAACRLSRGGAPAGRSSGRGGGRGAARPLPGGAGGHAGAALRRRFRSRRKRRPRTCGASMST